MDDAQFYAVFIAFLNVCAIFLKLRKRLRERQARRWAVRPNNRDWIPNGYFRKVFMKMKEQDEEQFFIHTRMTRPVYDLLLTLIKSYFVNPRNRVSPEERLSITLLYLAHGVSMSSIARSYKLGKTTVRNIVLEMCELLWQVLSPKYFSEPTTAQYADIAKDYKEMWNLPNCVGAIGGKHIAIICPKNSGSLYVNYKKFFSVVLMATCDAKYSFTWACVGSDGSKNDGGVFRNSLFGRALLANELPLPPHAPLWNGSTEPFPHFFVGDAAFPLKINLMRPYPGSLLEPHKSVFNFRLSRACRVIENSFGILTARWRVLRTTIECSPDNSEKIVLGCLVLHNFIMINDQEKLYCPDKYADWEDSEHRVQSGEWRQELDGHGGSLHSVMSSRRDATTAAFQLRDNLSHFLLNEGAVPFY